MKIAVFLAPCEEGGFTAYIPSLPGCISEGETVDEALANIREAFELYVEPTEDDLIPEEDDAILRELELDWQPVRETDPAGSRESNAVAPTPATAPVPAPSVGSYGARVRSLTLFDEPKADAG